jgi:uncharacterized membrane protein YphA (DoxX/SURF4 family)
VFIALVVVTVLLAVICVNSAVMKLRRNEQVLAVIHGTVGVPERQLPVLAGLELAGAAGILVGLWLEPLGIAAAVGLVAYFVGAVGGHLRVRDTKNLAMPIPPLVFAVAVLALRLLTL